MQCVDVFCGFGGNAGALQRGRREILRWGFSRFCGGIVTDTDNEGEADDVAVGTGYRVEANQGS